MRPQYQQVLLSSLKDDNRFQHHPAENDYLLNLVDSKSVLT